MTPAVTLSRALSDLKLFGGTFSAASFWTWRTVAKVIDGLPLAEQREADLFRTCTGRSMLPTKPARRLILLAGRRAGKDRFLSAVAVWRAALACDWSKLQSAGEGAVVILLGRDKKQAAILRRYCHGLLEAPLLAREVVRQTGEVTEFRNGSSLEIASNDIALVRGRSAIAVLGSECAHWKTDEHSASSDEEVVGAAEPSMAMCPDGGLLLLGSSVYRKRGYMFRMFRKLHGDDEAEDICWFAPSQVMNPRLPSRVVDAALAEEPLKAGAEFLNRWREDLSDFVPADVVESCTDFDVLERPPQPGVRYVATADAALGTGKDSFALAVAHREGRDRLVLDLVRERKPRFVPAAVIAELAQTLRGYGITEVWGDRTAGGFHSSEWARNGFVFRPLPHDTSENYLRALPVLLAGRARLIDNATLRAQLTALERHVLASKEVVQHPSVASAHDDVSCAACAALVMADHLAAQETPITVPYAVCSAGEITADDVFEPGAAWSPPGGWTMGPGPSW
jgi:hypothetical protein